MLRNFTVLALAAVSVNAGYLAPQDSCCNIWADENYSGRMETFCVNPGSPKLTFWMDKRDFEDDAASWACARNVKAWMCRDSDNECMYNLGTNTAGASASPAMGYDD